MSGKNVNLNGLKLISPKEGVLAERTCDFAKELWGCEPLPDLPVTNWGDDTIELEKGMK